MKITVMPLIFALLLGAAWAQSVPPIFSPPYAGPLIDDTDIFKQSSAQTKATARFTIVQLQGETILLDTARGDTWQLISVKTDDQKQLSWKPMPKMNSVGEPLARCFDGKQLPSDEEPFDPFSDGTARLVIVASTPDFLEQNEFLILRASGNIITWAFIDASGKKLWDGNVRGNSTILRKAVVTANRTKTNQKKDQLDKEKSENILPYFSVLYIAKDHVEAVALSSKEQQLQFIEDEELKAVFDAVRKDVFGKKYHMPELLRVKTRGQGFPSKATLKDAEAYKKDPSSGRPNYPPPGWQRK